MFFKMFISDKIMKMEGSGKIFSFYTTGIYEDLTFDLGFKHNKIERYGSIAPLGFTFYFISAIKIFDMENISSDC